jgi:ABC-type polysaccharide/polyol phosphate export permease
MNGAAPNGGAAGAGVLAIPGLARADGSPRVGLIDHLFILRALILRSLRLKYRDNAFGISLEFVRIIVVVVCHYFAFWVKNKRMPAEIPIEVFVINSFAVWYAFKDAYVAANGGWRLPAGPALMLGVTPMHMRLAKSGWGFLKALLFCLAAPVLLNLFGDRLDYPDVLLTLVIFVIAGGAGFGYGMVVEQLAHRWPIVDVIAHNLLWLIYMTSGHYTSIVYLPWVVEQVFWFNPVLQLTEYQRHAAFFGYPVSLVTLTYPAEFAVATLFIGLTLHRWQRRRDYE